MDNIAKVIENRFEGMGDPPRDAIHKFVLQDRPCITEIKVDPSARIQHLGMQFGRACLWMQVNTENAPVPREILCVGTGEPFNRTEALLPWKSIGSIIRTSGEIYHYFWR